MGCILPRPQLYDLLFPSSHPLTSTGGINRRGKSTGRSMSELIPVGPVMREKTPVLQVSHQDFLLLASAPTALDNLLQEELRSPLNWSLKNAELLELLYSSLKAFLHVECL